MIKKPKNWENVVATKEKRPLPEGGYVVRIVAAKVRNYSSADGSSYDRLEIALDIEEGDYKGFYAEDFKAQQQEDKRWKGTLRQYIPLDDGSEKDQWTQSVFKAMTSAIEESNPGYHWDWDEQKLKGKMVGCLFRLEEWSVNGKCGWKAQPFKFISADQVRKGQYKTPKFKPHRDHPDDTPQKFGSASVDVPYEEVESEDEGDLPF